MEGFARDRFVEFFVIHTAIERNILCVPEQVFIPAVSHMKISVHIGTIHRNVRIALQLSHQFVIFISVCKYHISLQLSRFSIVPTWKFAIFI